MSREEIERKRAGRGFEYLHRGQKINNKEKIAYYKSLKIPPAWQEVKINPSRRAKILVTGIDKAGRLQYIYNPAFRAKQEKEKFNRILLFAQALPRMRRITSQHLKGYKMDRQKVLACIVRLMDQEYFRVGNEVYAQENQSYGITTMRSKHVQIKKDSVVFDFVGKSGKEHVKEINDKAVVRIVRKLDSLPGYEIFKYYDDSGQLRPIKSSHVNEYIKEIMGEEFSAKDFRTWGGTLLATKQLAKAEFPNSERERKKIITQCVKSVSSSLGNTPAITRGSYIDPRILDAYSQKKLGRIYQAVSSISRRSYLSNHERCVLKLLQSK